MPREPDSLTTARDAATWAASDEPTIEDTSRLVSCAQAQAWAAIAQAETMLVIERQLGQIHDALRRIAHFS